MDQQPADDPRLVCCDRHPESVYTRRDLAGVNLLPSFLGLVQNIDQNSDRNQNVYNGYEINAHARFGRGTLIAGMASGPSRTRTCQVTDPNNLRFCDQTQYDMRWDTQGKISGAYPLRTILPTSAS